MRVLFGTYVVWLVVCIYAVAYVMKNIYSVWYVCIIFLNTYFCSNVWSCLHKDIRQHKKQDGCLVIAVTVDNSSLGSFTYICDVIYVFLYFVK